MGNAKVVVGVRLLKVSLTSYGHSLLQPPRQSNDRISAGFSDLIRPFAIATQFYRLQNSQERKVSVTSYGHSLLQQEKAGFASLQSSCFSDLIRPFAIATLYSLPHMRAIIGFSDLIRPFAIATGEYSAALNDLIRFQ